MKDFEVIGLGALNIDHFYRVERILDDGEAVTKGVASYPGGSAANTIHSLAKLGVKTGFIGAVGDDDDGQLLCRAFKKVRVDTSQIKLKSGSRTGSVLCLSDELGKRSLYVTPGANSLLEMNDIDPQYIKTTGILHLATFIDDKQFEMSLDIVRNLRRGTKLSFSPGALYTGRGLKALAPFLKKTHILFINRTELELLTGQDLRIAAKTCLKEGCHLVVVTLGKGQALEPKKDASHPGAEAVCYIRDASQEYSVAVHHTRATGRIDTTGAGDAFAAGFLYGFIRGQSPVVCGRLGDIVAQFAIARMGARQGLPALGALARRYQAQYAAPL